MPQKALSRLQQVRHIHRLQRQSAKIRRTALSSIHFLSEKILLRSSRCCQNLGVVNYGDLAYKQLLTENEPLVRGYEEVLKTAGNALDDSAGDIQEQVHAVLVLKRKQVLQKQWRLQWGNKSIKVRTQIDRIVKIIGAFKEAGSVATNVDPLHAGLPWAGICFLLAVSRSLTWLAIKH